MSRSRPIVAALGVLLLGLPAVAQAQSSTPPPTKESGNPINDQGSNYNYHSPITQIAPSVPGLSLEVLQPAAREESIQRRATAPIEDRAVRLSM